MNQLGDSHNFGQSVKLDGEWVIKPRVIFWEWFFLSKSSPLREFAKEKFENDPFRWYPDLKFEFQANLAFPFSGKVSFFNQMSALDLDQTQVSRAFGTCMANTIFWGMTDLHYNNIGVGFDKNEKNIVVFPLDIETLFYNFKLLSHSYMLKSVKNDHRIVGIKKFKGVDLNIIEIVESFIKVQKQYNNQLDELIVFLNGLNLSQYPIRCILRNTSKYYKRLADSTHKLSLLEEEEEQLCRGDIPYFYTYIGSGKVYYLSENGEKEISTNWSDAFSNVRYEPITKSSLLKKINNSQLRVCILQILRNFDKGGSLSFESDSIKVEYKNEFIYYSDDLLGNIKCHRFGCYD